MTDFETFIFDNSDVEFRYLVKKHIFTPYEQDKKFVDESIYTTIEHMTAYIKNAIELPDGDILLELQDSDCDESITYHKLSEIELSRWSDEV